MESCKLNFGKNHQKAVLVVLLTVSIISVSSFSFASAAGGISLTASAEGRPSQIDISGETTRTSDITITVTAPNRNVVSIAQITPTADGTYAAKINTGGLLWSQDGFYKITAQQGTGGIFKVALEVEVKGGKVITPYAFISSLEDGRVAALEPERGLTLFADAIEGSTTITANGHTTSFNDITLTVKAPNGNVVSIAQILPDINGNFEKKITTGGPLWKQDGFYKITAQQGEGGQFKSTVEVEIIDGRVIPEFGAIAALILAVAIISIIAVSARSRLSIMPKY
ncbi:MAG: PEFG-CTERM sorting domain-containing protein [Crenarchaeota archaeon]|nr:MAG: PEFG-CTERM sorting domain-containing protein [Thermoproteota archaeon]RDJ33572.1 MAG: PEFG-CTERM sorting domain-containing protein [Thermoproteota archaeon]RDJ38106.1 MAG: PEFG-CTERM sorting domain-containing protein [Thermoproteota archaeon]RDJ39125.1 MAG: PEFG-CTERM sorting domain-containing protein [Thermoproteota archaeon]